MILRIIFENPYRLVCVLKAWQFFRKESQKEQWVVSKADLNWQVEFKKVFFQNGILAKCVQTGKKYFFRFSQPLLLQNDTV